MQPKTTLFISAALTTFVLAVLIGVVGKFQSQAAPQPTATEAPTAIPTDVPTALPTTAANVTLEQAAAIAAQFLNQQDVYSAETTQLDGANVIKVTFSSGTIVYVSPSGQVLSIATLPPVITTSLPVTSSQQAASQSGSSSKKPKSGEHEHEDHD